MLDERNVIGLSLKITEFFFSTGPSAIAGAKESGSLTQGYVAEHIDRKFFIDDDQLGVEVRCHSSQSGQVFGGLNLLIGVGDQRRYRAEHHRSGEDRHRGNALRHDDDHPIAFVHTMSPEYSALQPGAAAELSKGHGLLLVLIDPGRNEGTVVGSRIESVDEIAISDHTSF